MTNTLGDIWDRIEKRHPKQCWLWKGRVSEKGYGRLDIDGEVGVYAHRAAYISAHPKCGLPLKDDGSKERCVLHRCDNPPCCNPRHLFIGTHQENMEDKMAKGRAPDFRGEKAPRAKLTDEDVTEIRRKKNAGVTIRQLVAEYCVSRASINSCLYGRTFLNVPAIERIKHKFAQKLTTADVLVIRKSHIRGERAVVLAKQYGVTERAIHRVLKTWSALDGS